LAVVLVARTFLAAAEFPADGCLLVTFFSAVTILAVAALLLMILFAMLQG
jgi:hypothetical protein